MREWTILNINIEVLARARETHFIHFFGILSAFSQFQERQNVTQKNRHNFRNCSFFVTRGPQTDLLEEVEIFATHEGAPTHLLG